MSLGETIYKLRTEKNMSQGDLADALEVSRQSISKWETNSSVPELDKLIKLSEIFDVSLDTLVLNKHAQEATQSPPPQVVYVEKAGSPRKTAGIVLLCFSALLLVLTALLGDLLVGLIYTAPFAACGLICVLVRKHTGLWCSWVIYFIVDLYLRYATGVTWRLMLRHHYYTEGWTVHLIVAWCLFLCFAALLTVTALRFRKMPPTTFKKALCIAAAAWFFFGLSIFLLAGPTTDLATAPAQVALSRFASSVAGWLNNILFAAALVFTVRLLCAFWSKHRKA